MTRAVTSFRTVAAEPIHWGSFRATATAEHPSVPWFTLTDPQTDVTYLSMHGVSQRGIALAYAVAQPTVHKHLSRAKERLSTTLPMTSDCAPEVAQTPTSHRLCAECDTPNLPCCACVARIMAARPIYVRTARGGLVEAITLP